MQVELLHLYKLQSNSEDELFEDFILKVESDDKAKIPFGKPRNPIDSGVRPHGRILTQVNTDGTNDVESSGERGGTKYIGIAKDCNICPKSILQSFCNPNLLFYCKKIAIKDFIAFAIKSFILLRLQ